MAAVQLTLPGLIVFTVSLVVASSLLTGFLTRRTHVPDSKSTATTSPTNRTEAAKPPGETPPWGDLVEYDIQLERPQEYAAFEFANSSNRNWTFDGMTLTQVRETMLSCGLEENLIQHALSPERAKSSSSKSVVTPDETLIAGLPAEARSKLYAELARSPENYYMHTPFIFPKEDFDGVFTDSHLEEATIALVRQLSYRRGERIYFSDMGFVLDRIPTEEGRLNLVKALSRLSAVMARLRIAPTTDVDKLVSYWTSVPGVRSKDVRPLLESMKRRDGGGTLSLVYLLPSFARERLFTFPTSPGFGEAEMDCHWSTMNFFREEPDNRFADLKYTSAYVTTNYYNIARPSIYGDLVFVVDDEGGVVHSAVYIANDIVFTKNGKSYGQPWLFMRLKDMVTAYSSDKEPRLVFYRNKAT